MLQRTNGSNKPKRRATYEDMVAVPEHLKPQIIDGELYIFPHPATRHTLSTTMLLGQLFPAFHMALDGPGGWWIFHEPWVQFGENILVPDLAGWRCNRLPEIPDENTFAIPPDWVCEVLSPSTERIDRGRKRRIFAREGVRHLWFVDPREKSVEVYELEGTELVMRTAHNGDEPIRAMPFEAIEIPLTYLWNAKAVSAQVSTPQT